MKTQLVIRFCTHHDTTAVAHKDLIKKIQKFKQRDEQNFLEAHLDGIFLRTQDEQDYTGKTIIYFSNPFSRVRIIIL